MYIRERTRLNQLKEKAFVTVREGSFGHKRRLRLLLDDYKKRGECCELLKNVKPSP